MRRSRKPPTPPPSASPPKGRFFIALVPTSLSEEQVEAALDELGVDANELLELGGWRTLNGVAVVRVQMPEKN